MSLIFIFFCNIILAIGRRHRYDYSLEVLVHDFLTVLSTSTESLGSLSDLFFFLFYFYNYIILAIGRPHRYDYSLEVLVQDFFTVLSTSIKSLLSLSLVVILF